MSYNYVLCISKFPPKCGYCYYRFFISTNAMSIIVITPGYNLIPINNFATSFFLCKTLSIKYCFIEIYCRIIVGELKGQRLPFFIIIDTYKNAKYFVDCVLTAKLYALNRNWRTPRVFTKWFLKWNFQLMCGNSYWHEVRHS